MANIITSVRILCSIGLCFCPTFSPVFYTLYIIAGLSDMIDGAVARKTNTVSEFGSRLDTVADFIFVVVCLFKCIPALVLPGWLYIWIAAIAGIKVINIVMGFVVLKKFPAVHSVLNKATGVGLFLLPLSFLIVEPKYSAVLVCIMATCAAIQEGYYIRMGKEIP